MLSISTESRTSILAVAFISTLDGEDRSQNTIWCVFEEEVSAIRAFDLESVSSKGFVLRGVASKQFHHAL